MKILLLGAQGQLGEALGRVLPFPTKKWGRSEFDFERANEMVDKLKQIHPDIVINTAAMTDVDACEREQARAYAINAEAPGVLARVCRELDAVFVHVSTEYVFGGDAQRRTPYVESDAPSPVNYYGQSKLEGEQKVIASGCAQLLVRTSHLYGKKNSATSYVDRILTRAQGGSPLKATEDQVFSVTWTEELARAIGRLIGEEKRGLVHVVNVGAVNHYTIVVEMKRIIGLSNEVLPARQSDFPERVPRPLYSALSSERLNLIDYMSDWKGALTKYLQVRV